MGDDSDRDDYGDDDYDDSDDDIHMRLTILMMYHSINYEPVHATIYLPFSIIEKAFAENTVLLALR